MLLVIRGSAVRGRGRRSNLFCCFNPLTLTPAPLPSFSKKNFKKSLEKQKGIPCKKYKGMISRVKFELGTQKKVLLRRAIILNARRIPLARGKM